MQLATICIKFLNICQNGRAFWSFLVKYLPKKLRIKKYIYKKNNLSCFKSRLSLIVRMNVVLNRTVVVDSDCQQHCNSLSTTTGLFRTTFTRTIKLNLLLKWLLGSNLSQFYYVLVFVIALRLCVLFSWSLSSIIIWADSVNFKVTFLPNFNLVDIFNNI